MTSPSCGCGKPISPRSITGLCRSCACRRAFADPAFRQRRAAAQSASVRAAMTDEDLARRRRQAAVARSHLTPEHRAAFLAPELRRRVAAANTERALRWCPLDRRDEYHRLRKSLRYSAAEARAIIEADLKLPKEVALPPPARSFEDQLARVRAGARLVEVVRIRRPDPEGTLGGVGSGML